jgi:N-acetylglutamate synthase-like GNAT family acetyltransferase
LKSEIPKVILVREAENKDAAELTELLGLLANGSKVSVLPERLEEVRNRPDSFVFVAESVGKLIGTVQITLCPDIMYRHQPYAIVENLFVREEARRQGAGKALLDKIERLCLDRDCSKIMLLSSSHRKNAHHFFQSMGYDGDSKKGFVKYRKALMSSIFR